MQKEKIDKTVDNGVDIEDIDFEELNKIYARMHTPWKRRVDKISRNDICPFCNSGKKFKKCECYTSFKETTLYTINYD